MVPDTQHPDADAPYAVFTRNDIVKEDLNHMSPLRYALDKSMRLLPLRLIPYHEAEDLRRVNGNRETVLHKAAMAALEDVCCAMVPRCDDETLAFRDDEGCTAGDYAKQNGLQAVLDALARRGVEI